MAFSRLQFQIFLDSPKDNRNASIVITGLEVAGRQFITLKNNLINKFPGKEQLIILYKQKSTFKVLNFRISVI